MQKKIIALAIAGLSSAAFAQSNVTISGRFSVGFENVSAGGATAANSNYTSRARVVDNNSWLRFSGEEALGGGTSAWFQVESAIGTSNNTGTTGGLYAGTNTATLGARNTAVGLKGGWGTALIGKWDVHYNSMSAIDISGLANGLAMNTNSLALMNYINGNAIAGSGRDNNVLAYISPNWNGFSVKVGYTTVGQAVTPNLAKKDSGWQLNPSYNNGPVDLAYSYLAVNGAGAAAPTAAVAGSLTCVNNGTGAVTTGNAACAAGTSSIGGTAAVTANTGNGSDVRSNRLGGAYSFPMGIKVGLIYDKTKVTNNGATTGATWTERKAWAIPMSYTTGAHKVSFTWAKAGETNTDTGTLTGSDAKFNMLGYEYSMSKRTIVGVSYTQINNGSTGRYDFWHPSHNISGSSAAALNAGADPRSFSVNLQHTF